MYNEKNNGFSLRDIFIQLLFIILFIFILVWLFPTKATLNNQYLGDNDRLSTLTSAMFGENLKTMKDAAVSYYTVERLPEKVNDIKSMTLKEMINKHLVIPFIDGNGNECDINKSYVEVVKLDNEYQMKVSLTCTDNDAYIIVHLGCYDYCKAAGVCEKNETPVVTPNTPAPKPTPTCNYISKTESILATASTSTYCPSGYDKSGNTCVKSSAVYYDAKCPEGYSLNNGVCYGTQKVKVTADLVCPTGYNKVGTKCYKEELSKVTKTPTCPANYELKGNVCSRTVSVGGTTTYEKGAYVETKTGSSVPQTDKNYYYETVSSDFTYDCEDACSMKWIFTYRVYKTNVVTVGQKTETLTKDATCEDGYTLSNGVCYKQTKTTDTKNATCAKGYEVDGDKCSKTQDKTITKTPSCPTGYDLKGERCYGTVASTANLLTSVSYSCPAGYTLSGRSCTRTVQVCQ